ncbi:myeloid leukemia factor isoform X1 [Spodoptera litura]|uniref:Myeloid leukemia factor isoform X1 n=1 Tax=Spodoptera litura TaxID=69820 RepID=A0A9J7IQY4_SPOLT|nr:myeloid leukemia factor isoform X1 [Spodoptera litura]
MSLFGSLMGDVEDDPFFGSHMRQMRQMNNMMNSLFADPFGMFGGEGPLSIMGPRHTNAMMPFMPHQMPALNRLFTDMGSGNMHHVPGSSFSSSTVVMSSGPGGKPQVYSSTSSTKIGPNGIKETCKTVQDSRTGTKKMAIGHHIGERAHLIEREQNYYTGDAEERQEFINLDEEEAEEFDREFQYKAGSSTGRGRPAIQAARREPQRLALPAPPPVVQVPNTSSEVSGRRPSSVRPASRRPIRTAASPLTLTSSPSVREVYGGSHPQRHHRHKQHKAHAHRPAPADN